MLIFALLLQSLPLRYVEQTDPMTDKLRYMAAASDGHTGIAIGCDAGHDVRVALTTDLYLKPPFPLLDTVRVKFRAGSLAPDWMPFDYDDEHNLHFSGDALLSEFLKQLFGQDQLRLRFTIVPDEERDVVFQLGDAKAAISNVLQHCKAEKLSKKLLG